MDFAGLAAIFALPLTAVSTVVGLVANRSPMRQLERLSKISDTFAEGSAEAVALSALRLQILRGLSERQERTPFVRSSTFIFTFVVVGVGISALSFSTYVVANQLGLRVVAVVAQVCLSAGAGIALGSGFTLAVGFVAPQIARRIRTRVRGKRSVPSLRRG